MGDATALEELAGGLRDRLLAERGERSAAPARMRALVDREAALLDAGERDTLAALVAERSFGLGPLEPLLADPDRRRGHGQRAGAGVGRARRAAGARPACVRVRGGAAPRDRADPRAAGAARRRGGAAVRRAAAGRLAGQRRRSRRSRSTARCSRSGASARARLRARRTWSRAGRWPRRCATSSRARSRARCNVLVSGGTGSGKTTTLNALSGFIGRATSASSRSRTPPSCGCASRTSCGSRRGPPNLEGRGEVTVRRLVRNALRMRPDRIVVGEVRGAEALDMLERDDHRPRRLAVDRPRRLARPRRCGGSRRSR